MVTPVQVIEEKENEKTPSPAPDAQIWDLPQNEQEVKSVLDNDLPDALKTQEGTSKDDLGSRKLKDENSE